jgi:hypothetical protein
MDKFFLKFDDPYADMNFARAREMFPSLMKFETNKSIAESHKSCATQSFTNQFMVIDADNYMLDFSLDDVYSAVKEKNKIYIFRAKNPVNDLEYGHGGVKVFQRELFIDQDVIDFSTSFVGQVCIVNQTLSIHSFNVDPFHAWRTAVRECVKLSAEIIPNRNAEDDEYRLGIWCSKFNNVKNAEFVEHGAKFGREFGHTNKDRPLMLKRINDFKWLKQQYEQMVAGQNSV